MKKNGVNYSMNSKAKLRRKSALERLESQLKSGKKTYRFDSISLTEEDKKRIESEIETLKTRI